MTPSSTVPEELHAFAQAALAHVRDLAERHDVPQKYMERVHFHEDGRWTREGWNSPYWHYFVKLHYDYDLERFPGLIEATESLWQKGFFDPIEIRRDGQLLDPTDFGTVGVYLAEGLLDLVLEYPDKTRSFEIDPSKFSELVEAWWTRRRTVPASQTRIVVIPLLNFESDVEPLQLSDELELTRFSSELKTYFWSSLDWISGFYRIGEFAHSNWMLTGTISAASGVPIDTMPLVRQATLAITSMRLGAPGHVGTRAALSAAPPPSSPSHRGGTGINDLDVSRHSSTYRFSSGLVRQVLETFAQLREADDSGRLRELALSLRRFNQSYERERLEDQIIDLTIALESSILFGTHEELSHRLAMRAAVLLWGQVPSDDTFSLIRHVYKVRSKIVHAGMSVREQAAQRKKDGDLTPDQLVEALREVTSKVLLTYLANIAAKRSLEDINNSLDSMMRTPPG